ncbi:hypothetical protein [Chryseoglobus sp. 28M-23]|uniref:hypothetical protein n=1 Tax=Chryseoglobus sp. 28M-23 TaxID=2772253 RepID=UPI001CD0D1F3|nr:hypothetical protein [Chryseoglobus sp. 28M-23]
MHSQVGPADRGPQHIPVGGAARVVIGEPPTVRPRQEDIVRLLATSGLLGYDDTLVTDEQRQSQAASDENETVDGRWRYIEHTETHTRVMIRLQRQMFAIPDEVRITGVIYLPWRPGNPITSQLLRELPTARIEAAIN